MDLGLHQRVALVTGGSRGIGKATVRQLAGEGARVALTYHTGEAEAQTLIDELHLKGGDGIRVPMDLASVESIDRAVKVVADTWGRIDILVNNAFHFGKRRIADTPEFDAFLRQEWSGLLRANIEGTLYVTQTVIPLMRRNQWGRIVNVSSTVAEDGLRGAAAYGTAKAALHGLTRTLSKELGPAGILVNTILPGLTATERISLIPREVRRQIEDNIPVRRILEPSDVAAVIAFLCSATNCAVTGEMLRVSGGRP